MLGTGGKRRIARRLAILQLGQTTLQRRDLCHQRANDRLGFGRKTADLFVRERERHAYGVAKIAPCEKPSFLRIHPQPVNGYRDDSEL